MAPGLTYFADTIIVTLNGSTASGTTLLNIPVGVLKNVEMTGNATHVGLWGMGSIKRQDVAKREYKVEVRAQFAKFTGRALGLIMGGATTADTDVNGETATGFTRATVVDTNNVTLFDLTGSVTNVAGTTFTAKVIDCYFEGVPINWAEGEFQTVELTGEGADLILSYDEDAPNAGS